MSESKKTDIKEIKMKKLYNKSDRAFAGIDKAFATNESAGRSYVFAKDTSMDFSEAEATKLLEFYPKEILTFDGVNVVGVTQEKHDKVLSDLEIVNNKIKESEEKINQLKIEVEKNNKIQSELTISNTKLQAAEAQINQLKAEVERYKKQSA